MLSEQILLSILGTFFSTLCMLRTSSGGLNKTEHIKSVLTLYTYSSLNYSHAFSNWKRITDQALQVEFEDAITISSQAIQSIGTN